MWRKTPKMYVILLLLLAEVKGIMGYVVVLSLPEALGLGLGPCATGVKRSEVPRVERCEVLPVRRPVYNDAPTST